MATYTNLASLSGLQVGDVVNYDSEVVIDFTGIKKVQIVLNGRCVRYGWDERGRGGKTEFTFQVPTNKTFLFSNSGGTCFCYGDSYDAYKRIAVAGNPGYSDKSPSGYPASYTNNSEKCVANGGGLTGATVDPNSSDYEAGAGTQSEGGLTDYSSDYSDYCTFTNGSFGLGGRIENTATSDIRLKTNACAWGGDGWYGGGAAFLRSKSYQISSRQVHGGGGSGFVIGQSTSVYPSGYMGNDASLISELESSVSNATLTQGGAPLPPKNITVNGSMILTIVELDSGSTASVQVYDSTQQSFVPCEVYYYNNGNFQLCEVYQYDNGQFIKINV